MKGVFKNGNRWVASYGDSGKNRLYFKSKKEAEYQRKQWINIYGNPSYQRKNYDQFENENFKVIGDTGKKEKSQRIVLARNKHTDKIEEINVFQIKKGVKHSKYPPKAKRKMYFSKTYKKWRPQITLNKKLYALGSYDTEKEAEIAYNRAFHNYYDCGIVPLPKQGIGNSMNHKNISKSRSSFVFKKIIDGNEYSKYFKTLDEAVTYRNKFLNEHNLPIPD